MKARSRRYHRRRAAFKFAKAELKQLMIPRRKAGGKFQLLVNRHMQATR